MTRFNLESKHKLTPIGLEFVAFGVRTGEIPRIKTKQNKNQINVDNMLIAFLRNKILNEKPNIKQ